ncbi:YbaB/EbfC family nucleoid-associated protein [Amycolatopsis thailandensis]|uniref:YbaB/EbfC family nucleoid-associated protein n=1 Tax=Amycolatopsis thailandensis TaxID=589330 RepID=UPI00363FF1FD
MTAAQDPRVFRDQVRSMEARLTGTMHIGRSADQAVAATVTGRGELVDLRISDNALDRAHPQLLGTSIVQAVYAARGAAHTAAVPELAASGRVFSATPSGFKRSRSGSRATPRYKAHTMTSATRCRRWRAPGAAGRPTSSSRMPRT